jgi:hypothetical protein
MKKKVNFLTVALAEQLGGPWHACHGRGRGNPYGQWSEPLEQPHSRDKLRQDHLPTVIRKDTGKVNDLNVPGTPQNSPQTRGRGQVLKESISLLRGEEATGRKTSLSWSLLRNMRSTRMD